MAYQLSSFRRFPSAFAIVAASALAFTGLIASTSPVQAQPKAGDYRCAGLAEQARTAADAMQKEKQSSANQFVATGKKLCGAGNHSAAPTQYRPAATNPGLAEAETTKPK